MLKLTDIGRAYDERLVEDIRNGSQKAMKKVYDRWSGYLLAICTRYIPDKEIAEDILQDSFVKIFSSIGSFKSKGEGAFKAWISRITVNEALMYLRKQKRCNFIEFQDHLPDIPEDAEPDIGNIPAAEIQKMIHAVIRRALENSQKDGELSAEKLNKQLLPIIPIPAVTDADILVTMTPAKTPVFDASKCKKV